ncbi:DUF2339 domain-containing protein [Rhodoferax bucti]|uniref:DUF2339 domain-containing protein n=1 Tax=Rhodoferax bucti TaxID=2576305 RepID=UPI00147740C2|nr:DUF2339 domain-containing protein [Rhodoferax bucti]
MVLWGAIWGAIIGFASARYDQGSALLLGALLGALAGVTLRRAIQKQIAKELAQAQAAYAPTRLQAPAAPDDQAVQPATAPAAADEPWGVHTLPPEQETVQSPELPQAEPAQAPGAPARHRTVDISTPPDLALPGFVGDAWAAAKAWLLGGNTIVRAGVLVLFVGLAFLAKFAADNALLPPELRLAAVGAAGIALLVFGWRLKNRQPSRDAYALTLQGAGVAVLYLTVFAAFRLYQLLPAQAAFGVLALICALSTAIALLQNALPMAFIGFAGAFAAPLLVSTGQGNHVGLFAYYLLLGVGIAVVAWLRAWRALNLLGFFATFGVATLWGSLKYEPALLSSTEPFLLAFFALYLLASLFYATRHGLRPQQAVDATLIFGLPIVAFGLQAALVREVEYAAAFSALALGALYLGLGWWALRRQGGHAAGDEAAEGAHVGRWLAECFLALGMGFATLAVPLALDGRWTSAVWAAEGAAVFWMGRRQQRWLARLAGLVLQVLAAMSYLQSVPLSSASVWPLANPAFIGAVLLAASAGALAHWTRSSAPTATDATAQAGGSRWAQMLTLLEGKLSPVLFWVGFAWWQCALMGEIERRVPDASGYMAPWLPPMLQSHLEMLGWLLSAWAAHRLALPSRAQPWAIAATPAWFNLPVMLLFAFQGLAQMDHVFQYGGWWAWPQALVLHFVTLRGVDAMAPHIWWRRVHSGGVWLLVLLAGNLLVWAVQGAQLQGTSWAAVIFLVAGVLVLLLLCREDWYDADSRARLRWPLDRFAPAYFWTAALPLVAGVASGALLVSVHSDGNARPLPYVPLLNPTDITVALALLACSLWLRRVREGGLDVPLWIHSRRWTLGLAALAFVAFNTVWLRVAHHFAGVPWDAGRMFDSFLVQAGYSILWTLLALGLMLLAHRRGLRPLWAGGAGLLGLTVAKLFLVDLSNSGGSERIVAFIAVGVLMLVVGYVAPLPPALSPPPVDVPLDEDAPTKPGAIGVQP